MKSNTFRIGLITSLFLATLVFTSCEKEETIISDDTAAATTQKSAEIDEATDQVAGIVEETFMLEEGLLGKSDGAKFLPPCVTRTVVINGLTRTVTIAFEEDCVMPNGNVLSGIITIIYERDPAALTRMITYTFSDFFFNTKNIVGGGTVFREWSNAGGNPQSTFNNDITVTWQNEATATRVGERVREWVEGVGSGTWGDNVFLITGSSTTTFPNGDINTGIITTALRRELSCRFLVSGVIALTHNAHAGTLDFGDGSCDNEGIFTDSNGVSHTIILD